jgi:hypothetical protein
LGLALHIGAAARKGKNMWRGTTGRRPGEGSGTACSRGTQNSVESLLETLLVTLGREGESIHGANQLSDHPQSRLHSYKCVTAN